MKWKYENNQVVDPLGKVSIIHKSLSNNMKKKFVKKLNFDMKNGIKQTWMPGVEERKEYDPQRWKGVFK